MKLPDFFFEIVGPRTEADDAQRWIERVCAGDDIHSIGKREGVDPAAVTAGLQRWCAKIQMRVERDEMAKYDAEIRRWRSEHYVKLMLGTKGSPCE